MSFSSSSGTLAPKGRRTLPLFDYRKQMDGVLPSVDYVRDPDEADDFLEAIKSKYVPPFESDEAGNPLVGRGFVAGDSQSRLCGACKSTTVQETSLYQNGG